MNELSVALAQLEQCRKLLHAMQDRNAELRKSLSSEISQSIHYKKMYEKALSYAPSPGQARAEIEEFDRA